MRNNFKTLVLMATLGALFVVVGQLLGGTSGATKPCANALSHWAINQLSRGWTASGSHTRSPLALHRTSHSDLMRRARR